MTDRRLVVTESDLVALGSPDAGTQRRMVLSGLLLMDAPTEDDVRADALVDAAEVIKLRIEKKIKPMMDIEARVGMAGYMANRIRAGGRAMMALTIENIMYRWLIARSEAVRSGQG